MTSQLSLDLSAAQPLTTAAAPDSADIRTAPDPRPVMNGKPVYEVPARSVLNRASGFRHKLLCTGPTFTAGSACTFACTFCFVPDLMAKNPHLRGISEDHQDIVIRRTGAVDALRDQLAVIRRSKDGNADDPEQVLYMSPLVDIAGNVTLAKETIAACTVILESTAWQIRLLSKSNLLSLVAAGIPERYKSRLIFGVSTGTLNDNLARAFEKGTAPVSKRLHSLHVLQDRGYRTFGMICPSLPLPDGNYPAFARAMYDALRGDRLEHCWAEALNVRGESMVRTVAALREGGFDVEAAELGKVSTDKNSWEEYSRATFEAHAPLYSAGKLRFLQYVNAASRPWWTAQQARGAILL